MQDTKNHLKLKGGSKKMNKKTIIAIAIVGALILSLITASAFNENKKNLVFSDKKTKEKAEKNKIEITDSNENQSKIETPLQKPKEYIIDPYPKYQPNRFILWTNDGKHVMWGEYTTSLWTENKEGSFYGYDNLGAYIKGYYTKEGKFYGYYFSNYGSDNERVEKFEGTFKKDQWEATGLFGKIKSQGRYETFPNYWYIRLNEKEKDLEMNFSFEKKKEITFEEKEKIENISEETTLQHKAKAK